MQKIVNKHFQNDHPIFDEMERLYYVTSEDVEFPLVPYVWDESFESLVGLFNQYGGCNYNFTYTKKPYAPINLPKYSDKDVVLCFSGGKDSIATLQKLQAQGYNVYLYYLRGVNAVYDEQYRVIDLAKEFDCEYFIDEVSLSGYHDWIEHPMKNMIIANYAIQYGIRHGIGTKIAFGNYLDSTLEVDNFAFCGGDDIEMWRAYEKIIQRIIPDFHIILCLNNLGETLDVVCKDSKLLNLSQSCIGRAGLRKYNQNRIEKKYGIILPRNRCGTCYKCAVEYVYMADHKLTEYQPDYYKHCIALLAKNLVNETGMLYNIYGLWESFFHYPIKESIVYSEIKEYEKGCNGKFKIRELAETDTTI